MRVKFSRIEILAPTSNLDIESILSDLEVGYQIIGSRTTERMKSVAAIDEATPYDLTFCSGYMIRPPLLYQIPMQE